MEVLKAKAFHTKQTAKITGVCDNALTKCLQLYRHCGLDEMRKVNFYRPKSKLEKFSEPIEQYFRENSVASIAEAIAKTEELTGIRRG